MMGLTRDNVSLNALGVGVAVGCAITSALVPSIMRGSGLAHDEADFVWLHQPAAGAPNVTATATVNGTAAAASRGILSLYVQQLRQFPSSSLYGNWCTVLVTALLLLAARMLYQWMMRPFEYTRRYKGTDRLAAAFLRSAGDIPPGYPNTWFKVADVRDIPSSFERGAFRTDALGESLFIFRLPERHPFGKEMKQGEVVVLVESTLNGVDPTRDLDAAVNPRRNPRAQRWHSQEINQMIFIWHHDDNHTPEPVNVDDSNVDRPSSPSLATPQQPQWPIPLIAGMENWSYHGRVTHEIACHIQEIPENGADVAHLAYIHGDFLLSWLGRLIRHEWQAVWDPQKEPEGHIAKLVLNQQVSVLGRPVPGTSLDSNIDQCGPALVQLIFPTPFGKVAVIETVTPVLHTLQRAQNVLWAEKTVPRFMAKIFLMGLVIQFERDLPIWNHKHFLRKPLILKEDGPILKYRRWMKQFYSNREYQAELLKTQATAMNFANE